MQPGEIIAVGKRPIVSMPWVIVGIDQSDAVGSADEAILWCLAVLSAKRICFTPFNPVYCPSATVSVDCSFLGRVTLDEIDGKIGCVSGDELSFLIQELHSFHDHRQSINVVSLLMYVQNSVLPLLITEFSANDHRSPARKMAIDRVEQMNELFVFFVGIAELNPRLALQELAQRDLPVAPAKSDIRKLRKFYSHRSSSFVVSQLAEELILYCQCQWIREETRAQAEVARMRLIELFELTREISSSLSTMLLRLPSKIRDEICFYESGRVQ